MNNKTTQIKEIAKKIDLNKIASYLQKYPTSRTLKEIIKYSKRIIENEKEEIVCKLGTNLAYLLDTLVNKTNYIKNETEKKYWLEVAKGLFENTIGYKDKNKKY